MSDVAKPSSPPLSASKNGATIAENPPKARPEKPDEQLYKDVLAKAEREHTAAQEKVSAIKAKIETAQTSSKDPSSGKRQQELRSELQSIRQQQSGFKSSRSSIQEKIAALDSQLKSRTAEQNAARSRVSFKNVQEVDAEIQRLEKQVDAGTMKLVDEKKALAEISTLRKQRKGFAGFDAAQKGIEDVKSQIHELRKSLDNPEAKALIQRSDEINQELAKIQALWDERSKLHADQQEKYSALKAIKDEYYQARTAYRDYEQEQKLQRAERQKAERDAYLKDKRRKVAEKKLEEASEPAYYDEISAAEGLIRYFDPSVPEEAKALRAPSGFAAEAQRSVVGSDFRGTKVCKKEEREDNYFMGTGGKKAKKGKKGNATGSPAPSTPAEGKFNLSVGVIEGFSKVGIEPPMNQAGVPEAVKKLKQKRDQWKKEQPIKTKENIQKAQKEIDRLEAEAEGKDVQSSSPPSGSRRAHDSAKKPARANQSVNGTASAEAELAQENDAASDVAKDVEQVRIEDSAEEKV
ncbi:hypothetical protein MMC22_011367 [Lobaria immixta]|nr:hypothetical protein [Lobaria immixta]